MIIGSSFADVLYSGGSFLLGAALAWTARTVTLERHSRCAPTSARSSATSGP